MIYTKLTDYLCEDCNLSVASIRATLALFAEGATIPFIARYRKERTGGLDETQLKNLHTRHTYYETLRERQETVLNAITEQNKLTPELQKAIDVCRDKQTLEDLYLPYKQRRKTKADIADEQGLTPLAELILAQQASGSRDSLVAPFVSKDGPITTADLALEGAGHILSQRVSDDANHRQRLRDLILQTGILTTKISSKFKDTPTKFDMYAAFTEPLRLSASHRLLAIRRGDKEGILSWKITINEDNFREDLRRRYIRNPSFVFTPALRGAIDEAFSKTLYPSLQKACFTLKCEDAEKDSISVFAKNLENLLMAPPAGAAVIMGIDPGFRTGCKLAIVDATGHYKDTATIYPVPPHSKFKEAEDVVLRMIATYNVRYIAIGNGTGSKETMQFIKAVIKAHTLDVTPVVVNESGASVYSASDIAVAEYGHLDITVRGAISIAHRLQDPLAELVKIDPKAIGVGQYQHDVNQTQLKDALTFTTELAVNAIGVDINTASSALLTYIAGIGPTIAQNVVAYREKNGPFLDRKTILKVAKLGPKAYEQCVGFLRIKNAKNPLDDSAIHPESYTLVERMAQNIHCPIKTLIGNREKINQIQLATYVSDTIGLPTLQDITKELLKPGVDPRAEFRYATFADAIDDIADLKEGMQLEGVVTNVTNFGAFVDIGVHQDGLIHISKLSKTFVKNPHDCISVGEPVKVTVLAVDMGLKRIQLGRVLETTP
jgi:protein Tex